MEVERYLHETKNWFFEKIHNIGTLLVILAKKKRGRSKLMKLEMKRG
jgi:hypothetical protein